MKDLVINLDKEKVATWYQKSAGIRANASDQNTVETIVRDYIIEQCGPDYGTTVQDLTLNEHRDVNRELRHWELRISGDGPDFMKVCRGISENFAL